MAYTSVKGGAAAIAAAERLIQHLPVECDEDLLELRQIRHQLRAAVDQVMGEGSLYAPDLAALAFRQAEGDMAEAAFMVRAYRSTLPRLGYTRPVRGTDMTVVRRISSTFRDVPGGQLLGRTRDYTQRLLDLGRQTQMHDTKSPLTSTNGAVPPATATNGAVHPEAPDWDGRLPKVVDTMRAMGLIDAAVNLGDQPEPATISPASRCAFRSAVLPGCKGWRGPRPERSSAWPTAGCAATAAATTAPSRNCASAICPCVSRTR